MLTDEIQKKVQATEMQKQMQAAEAEIRDIDGYIAAVDREIDPLIEQRKKLYKRKRAALSKHTTLRMKLEKEQTA